MKLIFFGSSGFSVPSLKMLVESEHEILLVVTKPDKKKGRKLKVKETPVKTFASSSKLKIYQPEDLRNKEAVKFLKSFSADLFVVVAYGLILPQDILNIPKVYSINLHASLLPKYRGAAPINWALVNGEKQTGLTIIRMTEKLDAGDMILQRKIPIEKADTASTLKNKLSSLGGVLLLDVIRFIEADKIKFKKQPSKTSYFARKLKKEDGLIDWKKDAESIKNMIRGLDPWPCAFTYLDGKLLKIWKAETLPSYVKKEPGLIVDARRDAIVVACEKGLLIIKELQIEGANRMNAEDFLRGRKIEEGTILGKNQE